MSIKNLNAHLFHVNQSFFDNQINPDYPYFFNGIYLTAAPRYLIRIDCREIED